MLAWDQNRPTPSKGWHQRQIESLGHLARLTYKPLPRKDEKPAVLEVPMLDAFIIEEIQRRERDRDARIQPRLDQPSRYPMPPPDWRPDSRRDSDHERDDDDDRGVIILDMKTKN
jgi:hypothetical protein